MIKNFQNIFKNIQKQKRRKKIILSVFFVVIITFILFFIFLLPNPLFTDSYSVVVLSKNDELLGVKIAADQQWRFPATDNLNDKFIQCIVNYEDKRFFYHWGIDPLSTGRALKQNLGQKKIVSGGSTITMQTIRLMRQKKGRTYGEKFIEMFFALRLECSYSKNEILKLYAAHAPFGGNVVGIEAAAWRYFGRDQTNLSWAENAMLAVLPNAPSYINTAKNRKILKTKRDKLLKKLKTKNIISENDYLLAIDEEIPQHPQPYPMYAYHLVSRTAKKFKNTQNKINTTIDINLQKQANQIINKFNNLYKQNNINNIACLILEVSSGDALVYVGNAEFESDTPEKAVDMITAKRSTGSILKPFLYAAALSAGEILPKTLLKDTPTKIGGFSPENFDKKYDGAVHADNALSRSLNIPFVNLLKQYGIYKFLTILQKLGLKSINRNSENYGLSLVLGGAESSLWEISAAYASMARSLKYYTEHQSKYLISAYHDANYLKNNQKYENAEKTTSFLNAASIWWTFEAMSAVNRPGEEKLWQNFSSKQKVAWKTGTSFGFKDAWSVAVTPNFVVAVWVGNATGEPKAGIVGQKIAAPVLFELLNILPTYKHWFTKPYDDMLKVTICKKSGCIATADCDIVDSVFIPESGINTITCPYHKTINLDETETYLVNSDCYPFEKIIRKSWFILPPSMEYYYKNANPAYNCLPTVKEGCSEAILNSNEKIMEIIYPNQFSNVYIPINLNGDTLVAVFKVAHRNNDAEIYWFVNNKYITKTKNLHEKEFKLNPGNYTLTLIDNKGNRVSRNFVVVSRL